MVVPELGRTNTPASACVTPCWRSDLVGNWWSWRSN